MRNPEWWDPFTGESSPAGSSNKIELNLEPYESRVLVFSNPTVTPALAAPHSTFLPIAVDLRTDWTVTFPDLHHGAHMDHLHSWTDDGETRFYSGRAVYEKDFTFLPRAGEEVFLDFGPGTPIEPMDKHSRFFAGLESPVREAAQVYINNQFAGSIWKPPYRVEVTRQLRAGKNHLRIVVYNSALNEMAGRALPDYTLLNSRYGVRFMPQDIDDIKALPSGLLVPPQLISGEAR
jgi:hypothetical protein